MFKNFQNYDHLPAMYKVAELPVAECSQNLKCPTSTPFDVVPVTVKEHITPAMRGRSGEQDFQHNLWEKIIKK